MKTEQYILQVRSSNPSTQPAELTVFFASSDDSVKQLTENICRYLKARPKLLTIEDIHREI